jgi:hypothetical protein
MVIRTQPDRARQTGALTTELLVALALLVGLLLPLAYSFVSERKLVRACYQRAVAMEIVDGEFLLTVEPNKIRLQWQPAAKRHGGTVTREALLK